MAVYKLISMAGGIREKEDTSYRIQHLMASVKIPDKLKPGDVIYLCLDVLLPEAKNHISKVKQFIKIDREGNLQLDGKIEQ